jgi:hypothetical protein
MAAISGQASAHSYYNLTGTGTIDSGNAAVGFGINNSINGTDGVSAGSNVASGSPYRVADGTNSYNATTNNFISGTGAAAATATEVSGNLPYMWYSGQHTTAAGYTKRELYTGSSATDATGNLFAQFTTNGYKTPGPNGIQLPGTVTNWGANSLAGEWKAYNDKNAAVDVIGTPPAPNTYAYGGIMANPSATNHAYLAVAGDSSTTGFGLDYGLIHISCTPNTEASNCSSAGDVLTTITLANDSDYSSNNGLLDVALYRGADSSLTSSRSAAADLTDPSSLTNIQGSNLGAAIWTAHMASVSDILSYSFIFNQSEWLATDTAGASDTNGFYTLVIGGRGGLATDGYMYDVMVTTSAVPVPGAVWLFGSALAGLVGFGRRKQQLVA